MSQSDFEKFMSGIQTDAGIRAALADQLADGATIPAESLISLAREHGYSFTVEEAQEQLSDADLEGVTGGASYLKLGDIKGEVFPKVEYQATTRAFSFNFIKLG